MKKEQHKSKRFFFFFIEKKVIFNVLLEKRPLDLMHINKHQHKNDAKVHNLSFESKIFGFSMDYRGMISQMD